jgi:hypothetical protein
MEASDPSPPPVQVGDTVWLAHPTDPKGPPRPAVVVADKGLYEPPAPPQAGPIPPVRIIRVRFEDGQEQILPAFKVSVVEPSPPDA